MVDEDIHSSMALPDPLRVRGRLFAWPDSVETTRQLAAAASECDCRIEAFEEYECVALHLAAERGVWVLDTIRKGLSDQALRNTRVVFKAGDDEPTLADFPRSDSLTTFIAFARSQWLGDMMGSGRLAAWFQPIVDVHSPRRVVAVEALARGQDLAQNWILPNRLLSAARDSGQLASFDQYVHERAIAAFDLPAPVALFLNVDPRTLEAPELDLERILRAAARQGLDPRRITLELVECETIRDMVRVQDVLTEARSLGFGIALDDMGAGYSNLNLMHELRPDVVKLDMSLTRDVTSDPYKAVIVEKMLETTRRLGVRTVAEGVERPAELAWLQAHQVDYVQGFLIGRPAPEATTLRPASSLSA